MLELIAIAFGEETIAGQASAELERRADDLAIDPDAIGVVICERDGSYQLLTKRRPAATAAWSTFWGRLLELVMKESCPTQIDRGFLTDVREVLTPGTSVLFFVGTPERGQAAIDALSHYPGTSLTCSLADGGMDELREALDGDPAGL